MTAQLELRLLGKPQVYFDGEAIAGFRTAKAEALLYYLAVTARPHSRESLADLLWDDMPAATAKRNLTKVLSLLRKQFEPYLEIEPQYIGFKAGTVYGLDVAKFEEAIEAGDQETASASLREAVELYQDDFLAGFYVKDALNFEEWVLTQRERLRELMIQALDSLISHHLSRADYVSGIELAGRLLALESWRETTHRQMMRLLAHSGRREAALAQYETCRQILAEELAVEPMAETTALYERLKAAGTPPPHNLPPPPNAFVGRRTELQQIERHLANPACRLLTIVGPGGIGKTRLALESARRYIQTNALLLEPDVSDGVYVVSLASITEDQDLSGLSNALVSAIADAVGLSFHGHTDLKGQLLTYLGQKAILLVLDNFEHLVSSGKERPSLDLMSVILQHAPQVKLLVTSRTRLNLPEEWVIEVVGLSYPREDWKSGRSEDWKAGDISQSSTSPFLQPSNNFSAIALFTQRAEQVLAGFSLTEADMLSVVRICQLVEGMPLALELAASWLRMFTCAEVVIEIERSLDFLATSLRNVPVRHRSLRAVFEHSWGMLSRPEQAVFAKLSIFRGGFSHKAATKVAGVSETMLARMVDKSLLRYGANGRYELHELLRQYAAEKLLSLTTSLGGELTDQAFESVQAVWQRYSRYYLDLLWRRETSLRGHKPQEVMTELRADLDNIRQAWLWAVNEGQAQALEQASGGLSRFFDLAGLFAEGESTFGQTVDHLETLLSSRSDASEHIQAARTRILVEQARMLHRRGLPDQAVVVAQRATELAQALQPTYLEALARHQWGDTLSYRSAYKPAQAQLNQALTLARQAQLASTEAEILKDMAIIALRVGQYGEAKQLCRQAESAFDTLGDQRGIGVIRLNLGNIAYFQTDLALTKQSWSQAAKNFFDSGDIWGECLAKCNLGHLACEEGRYQEALTLTQQSMKIAEQLQDWVNIGINCEILGTIFRQQGDYETARTHYERGLDIARKAGYRLGEGYILTEMALLLYDLGQLDMALRFCREAQTLAEEVSVPSLNIQVLTNLGRIYLARHCSADAVDVFRQALETRGEGEDWRRAVEARASLAEAYRQQEDLTQATELIETVLKDLQQPATLAIVELFRVFLTCYRVLQQAKDSRAEPVLSRAYRLLQKRAAAIEDERLRRSFLEKVPAHREIVSEVEQQLVS